MKTKKGGTLIHAAKGVVNSNLAKTGGPYNKIVLDVDQTGLAPAAAHSSVVASNGKSANVSASAIKGRRQSQIQNRDDRHRQSPIEVTSGSVRTVWKVIKQIVERKTTTSTITSLDRSCNP